MKSERRHELETNYLANWLGNVMTEYAPYAKGIFGVLIVGLTLLTLFRYLSAQQTKKKQMAWQDYFAGVTDFYESGSVEGLESLAKTHQDTPAGAWAWQSTGDALVYEGAANLHVDRDAAKDKLLAARDAYQNALDAADSAMLEQRALLGLAQASEGLNELGKAKDYYQEILDKWPDKALGRLAGDRLAFLNADSTQTFYSWFVKQEPPERTTPDSQGSSSAMTPSIHSDLPDVPGLALPTLEDLKLDMKSLQAPEGSAVEEGTGVENAVGPDAEVGPDESEAIDVVPNGEPVEEAAVEEAAVEEVAEEEAAVEEAAVEEAAVEEAAVEEVAEEEAAEEEAAVEEAAVEEAAVEEVAEEEVAEEEAAEEEAAVEEAVETPAE